MRTGRVLLQTGFLALTITAVFILRGNAEAWCPFGGVEALYTFASEGNMPCSLGVSNFFALGALLLLTLLLKRAFCGYLCPIGTLSEWLGRAARRLGLPPMRVGDRGARWLGCLKYIGLALILIMTYRAGELVLRTCGPCYALLGRHGEDITAWAYVVAGLIVGSSLFLRLPFCRWLCPLAPVLQPFSRAALTRIERDPAACVDCGHCAAACPMEIDVDQRGSVTEPDCTTCLECVRACPVSGHGALAWGPPGALRRRWPGSVAAAIVLACVAAAATAAHFNPLPSYTHERGAILGETIAVELRLADLTCRGRATLLTFFLDRDDEFALEGYLKLEAWPGPGLSRVRVTSAREGASRMHIIQAMTEPYYNAAENLWRVPPFVIEGYDPLAED